MFRHVNLLVPPKEPRAQMGFIIMEPEDTPPMSGLQCDLRELHIGLVSPPKLLASMSATKTSDPQLRRPGNPICRAIFLHCISADVKPMLTIL